MKPKMCLLTLVGLLAVAVTASAQENKDTDAASPAAATITTNAPADMAPPAEPVPAPAETAPVTEAPAAAAPGNVVAANDAAPATPTPVAEAVIPAVAATPAPASVPVAAPGGVIPLIVMDDVPLTDAIKNLARQAGLNYMLDPKVSFGQIGADGKASAQPMVSIRWENVTPEQALSALLGNYNLQLADDPKNKISRITVKDPAAPDPLVTKVIQLKFASPEKIKDAVANGLTDKRSKVVTDVRTSQLVVLATEKELVDVDSLVEKLDTMTRQVLIETRMLETKINPKTQKGVDWSGTLQKQNVKMGNNDIPLFTQSGSGTVATLSDPKIPGVIGSMAKGAFFSPATMFLNADGVNAAISFLNTYGETKVISSPRTVTLDNQMALIEAGEMYPIVNTTAGTANTTGGSSISYSNLTVRLEVTPRISANDYVNLKVRPSVVRLGSPVTSTVGGVANTVDSFLTRSIDTSVMIPSGNTLVMGGLIQDSVSINNNKVPLLGDIPGLGYLFRWDGKERSKQNMTVFITPTIVQDQDFQATKSDYLKTPAPKSDDLEADWSAWDSGKPKDFSKKKNAATPTAAPSGQVSQPSVPAAVDSQFSELPASSDPVAKAN